MKRMAVADEWGVIEKLLPAGWRAAARTEGAFRRARYLSDPAPLLRLLLFHAVSDGGLRETVAQARASGIVEMSQVALLKRLRTAGDWLAWLGRELCRGFRERPRVPKGLRLRAVDSTTVQGPASKGTEWRVHYTLDLVSLNCDWHALTDARGGEHLSRVPVQPGDVLLGDRNFFHPIAIRGVVDAGGHVLIRLRWNHPPMLTDRQRRPVFDALPHARRLRVAQVGDWPVVVLAGTHAPIRGRVVAIRLPRPVGERSARRVQREATRKRARLDPRSLQAAHLIMLFTTLPRARLDAKAVLELYRCRWQIELTFKRLKQLLR
ncbi:MAG: transposase, partial [Steroidobacteraceae bacterium]